MSKRKEDENNFTLQVDTFAVCMEGGALTINDCIYEADSEDPTYALARAAWRGKQAEEKAWQYDELCK